MNSFRAKSLLSCAIVLVLLQGCGRGSNNNLSNNEAAPTTSNAGAPSATTILPAAPAVAMSFALKQLQFSWAMVDGATFYQVLEDADGTGAFKQVSGPLTALTFSRDIAVHTFNWAAARYQVQACNSAGCTSSSMLSAANGVLQTIGYFKASNTDSGDTFGWSLALSDDGTTLAIGAPSEDSNATGINGDQSNNGSADSGAVYVFVNSGSGWVQQAYVKASNAYAGANFGESVALNSDGNTLAVGAPFEDSSAGSAYVFTRSGATWSPQNRIKASNAYANTYFGWTVALSDDGHTLAIGAPGESNSGSSVTTNTHSASNAGAAYVFTYNAGAWSNQVYLKASTITAEDNFGAAIALNGSGSVLAVGSPYKSSTAGAAYVFTYASGAWGTPAYLTASNAGTGDNFGAVLALNNAGDTLAVGAPYEASNATGINGTQSNNSAANAGAAYVFTHNGSTWSQQAYIKASNTQTNDDFGSALALSGDGNTLVVGAIGESSSATGINGDQTDNSKDGVGAAYLFKRSNAAWIQQTYIKPSTSTLGDEFGTAIGMSADGSTLAISGAFEQSNAKGVGSSQTDTSSTDAGAVWLF